MKITYGKGWWQGFWAGVFSVLTGIAIAYIIKTWVNYG